MTTRLRVAGTVQDSIVDGPGLRFVVFTQGCPLACLGCHNPETQPLSGGRLVAVGDLERQLASNPLTTGLTLSGGEPSRQPTGCAQLAEAARLMGMSVWSYSGFRIERLLAEARGDEGVERFLSALDVLVDGPFVVARRTLTLPWRGSTNQRLIDVPATLKRGRATLVDQAQNTSSVTS